MSELSPIWFLGSVDSTNRYLKQKIEVGEISKGAVWARRQTAGKGRLGRQWLSPEGGLYISFATPVGDCPPMWFTVAAGVAPHTLFHSLCPAISLKWPNDLIATVSSGEKEGKVGGLLAEYITGVVPEPHVIVGLGVNINASVQLSDADASMSPLSLASLTGHSHELSALVDQLSFHVFQSFEALLQATPNARESVQMDLLDRWQQASSTLGREVRIEKPDGTIEGTAVGLSAQFALQVRTSDGILHEIQAGDCIHLRPKHAVESA